MEYLIKFKNYLFSLKPAPSKVTVKNYSLDVKHFIVWFEEEYQTSFDPKSISSEHIALFRQEKNHQLSERSLDRHVSSLRKFFHFLKLQGYVSASPLDQVTSSQHVEDPYQLKQFKDFLYVYNASNLTIKNYIIDLKQFFKWAQSSVQQQNPEATVLESLDNALLASYRDALVAEHAFSNSSINRKLSSLRKYVAWANSQNLLQNQKGLPVNPIDVTNIPSTNTFESPERQQKDHVLTTDDGEGVAKPTALPTKSHTYSPFPPFRLAQKISKGINFVFDSVFITPLTHLVVHGHKAIWTLRGKPLFTNKLTDEQKRLAQFMPVKNISKSVFAPAQRILNQLPWLETLIHHARYTRPNWYKRYHSYAIAHYFNWAILMIVMTVIGFGFYNNFASRPQNGQHILAAAQPNRILSFQGRLTDSSSNPITTSTNLRFGIYTNATATGSALLWQEVDNVTPDANGVFSVLLGQGSAIQQSLFANNANLFLGITVAQTPELTPRQQLATVAYATNAETLQGLPPITQSGAGTSNVVLALNSAGNLSIGAASTFQTVGGAFTLSGDTLVLNTNAGTNGNITIAPDGQGFIDLQKPLINSTQNNNISSATGSVEVDDTFAVLATNSGIPAVTINQDGAGALFTASAAGVSKFTLGNTGTITASNYNTAGGIFYADGTGLFFQTAAGSAGQCLTSAGGGTPTWGSCGSGASGTNFWTLANGTLYPINTTLDVLFGGDSSSSAKFAFLNNAAGTPTASISGNITLNSAGLIQTTNNQGLTIGGDTTGNIVLKPLNGTGTVTIAGLGTGVVHSTGGLLSSSNVSLTSEVTGILPIANGGTNTGSIGSAGSVAYSNGTNYAFTAVGTAGQCLLSGAAGSPTWSSCSTAAGVTNYWTLANGSLYPVNTTLDVLFGGTSSSSANFSFLNNAPGSGTPTASISGNITLNSVGQIQTTNNQGLTIGGSSTGNITLSPLNGNGYITVNGHINSNLIPQVTNTYDLGSASLQWNNLYVNNIISGGTISGFWQRNSGIISPSNITDDLAIGGTATSTAKFQVFGNTGNATTAGTLTFDGTGSLIQTTKNQGLTIGGTTTGNITLNPLNGAGTVTIGGLGTGVVHSAGGVLSSSSVNLASEVTGILPIANGGTNTNTIGLAGSVAYSNGTNYAFTAVGSTNQCLVSAGSGAPSWTSCSTAAGATNYWTLDSGNGILYPVNTTLDVLFGGTSSSSANFSFLNNAPGSGTPTASISGNITLNSNGVIATTNNRPLTIGSATTGSVQLSPKGTTGLYVDSTGNVGIGTTTTSDFALEVAGNVGPRTTDTYDLGSPSLEWNNIYVKNVISTGTTVGFWQRNLGVVSPANIADDLAIGGTSTSSAKFQVFGNTGNATTAGTLTFTGTGSQIQTTSNQPLTLGGDSTGGITLSPNNGNGIVTVNGSALQTTASIFNAFTANATTLGFGVTGGTTTVNSALTATGIFTANNTTNLNGDVNLGNATADTIVATGRFGSSLVPTTDNTFDLGDGTTPLRWRNIYANGLLLGPNAQYDGFWQLNSGVLIPTNITNDFAIGGTATSTAKFQVFGNTGNATTAGTLTFTGTGSQIQTTSNQPLTLGGDTTGNIILKPNNGTGSLTVSGFINSDLIPADADTYNLGSASLEWNNLYVKNIITSGNTAGFWQRNLGTLSPANITDDILAGGTATTTAKFAVLNMTGSGNPTASVSSGLSGTGMYFAADGTIQTVRNQGLTIGGNTTGNITLQPLNGSTGSTINLNAATLATNQTSVNLLNTTATTINFGSAATTLNLANNALTTNVNIGGTSGTTTVNNALTATGVFTANNNAVLGATNANTINPVGVFSGSLIPQSTSINLGSPANYYGSAYITNLFGSASSQYLGFWQLNNGALSPTNITNDVLVGATSTTSAKFAVLNIANGTPTASVSSGLNGTGMYFAADGTIQTVRNETLTLGGNTTGNISFNSNVSSNILPYTTNTYDLGSAALQWNNIYANNIYQNGQPITQTWQRNLGVLAPLNITDDVAIGGTATSSAKFQIFANSGNATTTGTLTFTSGTAATNLIAARNNQGLTLGDNQTGNIILNGNNVGIGTTNPGSFRLQLAGSVGPDANNLYDLGSNALAWRNVYANGLILSATAQYDGFWQRNSGIISPSNITDDLAIGGTATSTAKFQVFGNTGNATTAGTLTFDGTGSLIQTTRNQGLTIGGTTTGNITLSPLNGISGSSVTFAGASSFTTGTGLTTTGGNFTVNGTTVTLGNGSSSTIQTTSNADLTLLSSGTGNIILGQNSGLGNITVQPNAGGNSALVVNKQGPNGDIFTASSSGVTKFTIQNDGTLIAKKYTTADGILYLSDTNGTVAETAQGAAHTFLRGNGAGAPTFNAIDLTADVGSSVLPIANGGTNATTLGSAGSVAYSNGTRYAFTSVGSGGQCLISNASSAPSWSDCSSAASNWWTMTNGALYPINETFDFFIGGSATTSAKFAVLNMTGSGTPVASVSSGLNGNAAYLTATGSLQTARNAGLTIGGDTTGNITLKPQNGNGIVTINGTTLDSSGTSFTAFPTATSLNIGNSSGTTTVNNALTTTGNIADNGGTFSTNQTTFNLLNSTATTINFGAGATTALNIGASNTPINLKGDVTLGTSSTNTITTTGSLATDLVPTGNGSINLGSATHYYGTVYANTFISPVSGGVSGFWQLTNNVLSPVNAWNDLAVGGNATGSATPWQVFATTLGVNTAGTATSSAGLSFRGTTTQVALLNGSVLNVKTSVGGDSGLGTVLSIANNGDITQTGNFTTSGNVAVNGGNITTTAGTASLFDSNATNINIGSGATGGIGIGNAAGTNTIRGNVVLGSGTGNTIGFTGRVSTDIIPSITNTDDLGSVALSWKNLYLNGAVTASNVYLPATGGVGGYWTLASNVVYPTNNWNDLAIGGTGTASAKFQVFANTGNATTTGTLTFNGDTANVIATRNNQGLTIGDSQTGNITLSALNGGTGSTINLNAATLATNQTSVNLLNTTATTINFGGAATTANLVTAATTLHLADAGATTTLSIGGSAGTTTVNNALTVTGTTTLNGKVNLGDATGDDITATGFFASSLIPKTTDTYNLGSDPTAGGQEWDTLYVRQIVTPSSGGIAGFWQLSSLGVLAPANLTNDLAVGGTATSTAKFQIFGSGTYAGTATTSGNLSFTAANTKVDLLNNATLGFYNSVGGNSGEGNPALYIASSGNIGIGTNSPQEQLQVLGESSSYTYIGSPNCGGGYSGISFGTNNLTCNNYSLLGDGTYTFLNAPSGGQIKFGINNNYFATGDASAFTISATGLHVTGSGPHYFSNGNVGIGTTSPLGPLDIEKDGLGNSALIVNQQNNVADILTASASGATELQLTNSGILRARSFQDLDNTNYFIDPAASGQAMDINGSAGIGTTSAQYKLDVYGDLRVGKDATNWGVDGYSYRRQISINNTYGQQLINYQVRVVMDTTGLVSSGKVLSSCNDVRFTDSDGSTNLNYWIEPNSCNTTATTFWVKVPLIPGPNKMMYMYYGNAGASAASSSTSTFVREISGVQGAWRFDEPTYMPMNDFSGNGNNVASESGTTVATGIFGNARTFDGNSDYVEINDSSNLRITQPLSVAIWFKKSSNPSSKETLIRKDTQIGTRTLFGLNFLTSGKVEAEYFNNPTDYMVDSTATTYADGNWHYAVMTISGTTMTLYVDGASTGTPATITVGSAPTGVLDIGAAPPYNAGARAGFFTGTLDEPRVYNIALSSSQITDLYSNGGQNYGYTIASNANTEEARAYVSTEPTIASLGQEQNTVTQMLPSFYVQQTTGNVALGTTSVASTSALLTVAGDIKSGLYDPTSWIASSYGESYRARITVDNTQSASSSANADYQVKVSINTTAPISVGKMRNDCTGVRFTDSDGTTNLNYWMEPGTCNTSSTIFWVKVPQLPPGEKKNIYIYYGNLSLSTSVSSAANTFVRSISGLQAAYSMDITSGTTESDTSGNGNTGTLSNGIIANGMFNNGVYFDGVGDSISIANSSSINFSNAMSADLWVKPGAVQPTSADIFSKHNINTSGGYMLESTGTGNTYFFGWSDGASYRCNTIGAGTDKWSNGGIILTPDVWQHVTVTKSGTSAIAYVNGVQVSTCTGGSSTIGSSSSQSLKIGQFAGSNAHFFRGYIDEVHFYNAALSAAEVTDLANPTGTPHNGYATTNSANTIYVRSFTNPEPVVSVDTEQDPSQVDPTLYVNNTFGRVGIGTANPTSLLTLVGSGNQLELNNTVAGAQTAIKFDDNGTAKWQVGKDTDNSFFLWDNTAARTALRAYSNGDLALMQSGGNVGIGTTTPNATLDVNSGNIRVGHSSAGGIIIMDGTPGGGHQYEWYNDAAGTSGQLGLYDRTYGNYDVIWGATGQMTVTSGITGGNFALVVHNDAVSNSGDGIRIQAGANTSDTAFFLQYLDGDGTSLGTVQGNGGGVTYTNTSDIRLKTDIAPTNMGLDQLLQIPVVNFHYKTEPTGPLQTGFIAQWLYNVFPNAVSVPTNPDDRYGDVNPQDPWGVDYGRITPLIVKAVQDLNTKVDVATTSANSQLAMLSGKLTNLDLSGTGDIIMNQNATVSADFTIPHHYTLTDALGNPIHQIAVLSEAVIGNLRVGSLQAQQTITNSLAVTTGNVSIAGQSLHDYIAGVVSQILSQTSQNTLTSPISEISQLHTNLISPLASGSAVALQLDNSGINVQNTQSGATVARIDNSGNATFSGQLQSQNLAVNGDATVSGTLHANRIEANTIAGLQAVVSTLSAQNITNVTNIYFATPSGAPTGENIATGLGGSSSTNSGLLNPYLGYTNLASYSGFLAYVPNLDATTGMFEQGLMSLGTTTLSDTTITGQLAIGSQLILADNGVNVLGATFDIQPLRQGGVNFEGGLLAIDTDGNLTVNGNAVFSKTLAANIISPISNDRNLTVKLGNNPTATGAALATSNLSVQNASGSGIFTIDQLGNVIASGAATIGKLNLQVAEPALAVSNTELVATGSAGTADVKAHQTEITIDNKLVTSRSLIYITPVGQSTITPYLIRQVDKTSFTVGIPLQQTTNTTFNWLIVN